MWLLFVGGHAYAGRNCDLVSRPVTFPSLASAYSRLESMPTACAAGWVSRRHEGKTMRS